MVSEIISNLVVLDLNIQPKLHWGQLQLGFKVSQTSTILKGEAVVAPTWKKNVCLLKCYLLPNSHSQMHCSKKNSCLQYLRAQYCEKTCAVSNLSFSIVIKHLADGSLRIFILQHTKHSTSVNSCPAYLYVSFMKEPRKTSVCT